MSQRLVIGGAVFKIVEVDGVRLEIQRWDLDGRRETVTTLASLERPKAAKKKEQPE